MGMADEEKPEQSAETAAEEAPRRRRGHAGKRKAGFKMPPAAAPVKGLLLNASLEEQQKAHALATEILSTWLGHKTRGELAKELGLPVVRVKQLSEAALSGMVAGLLKQPKAMPRENVLPEDDPAALRRRIGDLEKETRVLLELVRILREMPANKAAARGTGHEGKPRDPKGRGATGSGKGPGES